MDEDEPTEFDQDALGESGNILHGLLIYAFIAVVIIVLTVVAVLYPDDLFNVRVGFSTTESTLDTILLVLVIILFALFVIRIAMWLLSGRDTQQPYQAQQPSQQTPREQSYEGVAIRLDGRELTIMGNTIEVPEALLFTVHHVLSDHADEISRNAQEMQALAGGDDLGGVNWLLASLEQIETHVDDVRISFFKSMAQTAGSLVSNPNAQE